MKIDLEHLHYWMCAIRESENPNRTLDAFWRGQMQSKEWLVNTLVYVIYPERNKELDFPIAVDIHGGWVGTLASLLFQSAIPIRYICNVDLDPSCAPISTMMNKIEEQDGKFKAITGDMCTVPVNGDIVINTSCEHITQEQYEIWLNRLPKDAIVVLQSNNYNISEHVRIASSLEEFKKQCHIKELWSGSLKTQLYDRWMIIGKINV